MKILITAFEPFDNNEINYSKETLKRLTEHDNLIKGNVFFRHFILKPDIYFGIRRYNKSIKKKL